MHDDRGPRRTRTAASTGAVCAVLMLAGCTGSPDAAATHGVGLPTRTQLSPTAGSAPASDGIPSATSPSGAVTANADDHPAGGPTVSTVTAAPGERPSQSPASIVPSVSTPSSAPDRSPASRPLAPAAPSRSAAAIDGTDPFTGHRLVAYYGAPGTSSLGILGASTPRQAWAGLTRQAHGFDRVGHQAIRCFELIAVVAAATPGADGEYRNRVNLAALTPYLATVRASGGVLVLDIQPGRSDFLTEAHALQPLLQQPDVGLALDPEWRMAPGEVPGRVIGSVTADEVNAVSGWLDHLTAARHLPDKLFVIHQFTSPELRGEPQLIDRPHLHEILNIDGFGTIAAKISIYDQLAAHSPFPLGLKLFYRQDPALMTPAQVDALTPSPQLIDYQ